MDSDATSEAWKNTLMEDILGAFVFAVMINGRQVLSIPPSFVTVL